MNILRLFQKTAPEALQPSQADQAEPSTPSQKDISRHDMICMCKRMAVKELALADSAETRSLRVDHVYNAASWSERAELLQRIENSVNKRDALDAAEREWAGAADRLIAGSQESPPRAGTFGTSGPLRGKDGVGDGLYDG